ncbi:MAG: hypothetical protein ACKVQV_10175 [Bacteroidia bacterium]
MLTPKQVGVVVEFLGEP